MDHNIGENLSKILYMLIFYVYYISYVRGGRGVVVNTLDSGDGGPGFDTNTRRRRLDLKDDSSSQDYTTLNSK